MANRSLVRATLLLCANFATSCSDDDGDSTAEDTESTDSTGAAEETEDTDSTGAAEDTGTEFGESSSSGTGDNGFRYCNLIAGDVIPDWETFECGTPSVCEQVVFAVDGAPDFATAQVTNPLAAQCVLEALRDDVAATHVVVYNPDDQFTGTYTIEAFGDGTIAVNLVRWDDKTMISTGTWAERQPTEFFENCLTQTDEALFACLIDPADTRACVDAPPVCPAP